jgi:hypothetical protein
MIKHLTLSEQKGMITHPLHSTMKNPHSILLILAISSLVTVQPSFAESVDYSASVGVIIEDFHYEEENDAGDLLDSEDGLLPGLAFELKAGAGNWLVKGNYHLLGGEVDYQAYSGSDSELNSQTDTLINEVSLSLGYVQEIAENTCLEYFGGIGLRLWDRDIQSLPGISGLHEKYQWPYVHLALRPSVQYTEKDRGSFLLMVKKTFDATLDVEFQQGSYDPLTLDLGDGLGLELHASWAHQFDDHTSLELGPYLRYWRFDKSAGFTLTNAGVPVGMVHEPANLTRSLGFRLSLLKKF